MIHMPKLPLLPGYSFNHNIGQTRFHKSSHLEYLLNELPYLTEKRKPGFGGFPMPLEVINKYPSIYPRKESQELPPWIVYDKQMLAFDAFFQEALWEVNKSNFRIRKVKIFFYLEDGTIQVVEPKTDNSGMSQGVLISRQRIPFSKPMDGAFYEIIDLNIGKHVEFFGKVFKIVNCDNFTRTFLNRLGIAVGDPIDVPADPYELTQDKRKQSLLTKKPNPKVDVLGKFLSHDRQVLRFWAYWDDRSSEFGQIHLYTIQYYLADDTIEIFENHEDNCGCDTGYTFLKRQKVPKNFKELRGPGMDETYSYLNVVPGNKLAILDPLNCGYQPTEFYKDRDLAVGAAINVFNRKFIITKCDTFTQEYYRKKYGLESFQEIPTPKTGEGCELPARQIPPWNGFGTFEASIGNCLHLRPKHALYDLKRFINFDKRGADSHMLRMSAKMLHHDPLNQDRKFLITYMIKDNRIQVFEFEQNGFRGGIIQKFREMFKPNQNFYVPYKPAVYTYEDFWVGNVIEIEKYKYLLTDADEYTYRYMEVNCHEFPKSNIMSIMEKIKTRLKPQYKDFVCKYLRPCVDSITPGFQSDCSDLISFPQLREALKALMGNNITDQEIITVARHYRAPMQGKKYTKSDIQDIIRYECRRLLFYGSERLEENLRYKDTCNKGYITMKEARALVLGAQPPVDVDIVNTMMEMVNKNECGEVSIDDIMSFFDYQKYPVKPVLPLNQKREFSEYVRTVVNNDHSWVDCVCLLKNLGLEEELKQQNGTVQTVATT